MLKSKPIEIRPISFRLRTRQEWMDIIIPPFNGKEYFKKSQEKSGSEIARQEVSPKGQEFQSQLYQNNEKN